MLSELFRPEHKPAFSEDEQREIGEMAIRCAQLGEDAVDSLIMVRIRMQLKAIGEMEMQRNLGTPGIVEWADKMLHEIGVVNEVITRARVILRMQGSDRISETLQARREAGKETLNEDEIWGSI